MKRREFLLVLSGAMSVVWELRAQQKAMPVIGFLGGGSSGPASTPYVVAVRQGLSETGYVEGQNVTVEYRWAEARYDRLPALAADLVGRKVDVISATDLIGTLAAKNATSTIPIVFLTGGDPVRDGLVAGFARPGGNLTGISMMTPELNSKRLEVLSEMVPQAGVIALLVNPKSPQTEGVIRDVQETARAMRVQLRILKATTESEIDAAFASFVQRPADGLVVMADLFLINQGERIRALLTRHAIPAISPWREWVEAGALVAYGPSLTAAFRQEGIYVGKILNGAKPADLPVQQPTTFELVVNLNTAKALGITVPPSILARADEVIE